MKLLTNSTLKPKLMKAALNTLYYSQLHKLLQPEWQGVGAIFTLHHVSDSTGGTIDLDHVFSPNRILDISTSFLDQTLSLVHEAGFDIISLDEVRRRLLEKDFSRKFVSFTLDDGYQDNYLNAYPVFQRHNVPFTVYIATAFPDGKALLWWEVLEQIIKQQDRLEIEICGVIQSYSLDNTAHKYNAWDAIYRQLRSMPESRQRSTIAKLAKDVGVDTQAHCIEQSMSWDTLKTMTADGLATIGAHTVNHYALRKLPADQVIEEVTRSREEIEARLGTRPLHFSYPYGDAGSAGPREFKIIESLGFHTATTTRKAMLYPEHSEHLQALPRISLNGDFQSDHYTKLFLTGAPFALSNRFQKMVVG